MVYLAESPIAVWSWAQREDPNTLNLNIEYLFYSNSSKLQ